MLEKLWELRFEGERIWKYLPGEGVCQWLWGFMERGGLFAKMEEAEEDLVVKGNICEKRKYV